MSNEKEKKKQNKEEISKEINAKDIAWKIFEKTSDVNYYRLYSALKEDKK